MPQYNHNEDTQTSEFPTRGDALAGNAYERIREAIGSGAFSPGQRVTETQLAEWLSVSRTPVREAIQKLETEGLLVHSPRQGLIVRQLEYQEVVELYAMREVLESTAASLAAQQATETEIEILSDVLEMEAQVDKDDSGSAARYNRIFHETLHQAAHNRYLIQSIRALDNSMILLGGTTLGVEDRRTAAIEEHRAILAAIQARDTQTSHQSMAKHIREAQRKRLKILMHHKIGN